MKPEGWDAEPQQRCSGSAFFFLIDYNLAYQGTPGRGWGRGVRGMVSLSSFIRKPKVKPL